MARDHARIKVDIWGDDDWLDLSVDAQLLYLTLYTSPTLSLCGSGDWHPGRLAKRAADWTRDRVESAAAELSERLFLLIDVDTDEFLIRSWIKHDGLWRTPNMAVSVSNARAQLASRALRGVIVHEVLKLRERHSESKSWAKESVVKMLEQTPVDPADLVPFNGGAKGGSKGCAKGGSNPYAENGANGGPTTATAITTTATAITVPQNDTSPAPPARESYPADFAEWWEHYPRKTGKGDAAKAYRKAVKIIDPQDLLDATIRFISDPNLPEAQFIPHAATWLNGKRWDDGPLPARTDRDAATTDTRMARAQSLKHTGTFQSTITQSQRGIA